MHRSALLLLSLSLPPLLAPLLVARPAMAQTSLGAPPTMPGQTTRPAERQPAAPKPADAKANPSSAASKATDRARAERERVERERAARERVAQERLARERQEKAGLEKAAREKAEAARPAGAAPAPAAPGTLKLPAARKPEAPARPEAPAKPASPQRPDTRAPRTTAGEKPAHAPRRPTVAPPAKPQRRAPGKPAAPPPAAAAPAVVAPPAVPAEPIDASKGSVTGLPLPRFAALRSDEVNMRAGPGTRYPIDWTYQRRDLPVEIIREFELWRRIRDSDGTEGWVHQSTLTGRRTLLIRGGERVLHDKPTEHSSAVARLMPGVVGRIRHCDAGSTWCEVQVESYRGFLRRTDFWGVGPDEAVGD